MDMEASDLWLEKCLQKHNIPVENARYVKDVLAGPGDAPEKCEKLLELAEVALDSKAAEVFVREVLDVPESRTKTSLPSFGKPTGVNGTAKAQLNVAAAEFVPFHDEAASAWHQETPLDDDFDVSLEESGETDGYQAFSSEEILRSVFADIPYEEVMAALEGNNYDLERTLESLFPSEIPVSSSHTRDEHSVGGPTPGKQVCRHFLAGHCLRKDCWFSHDMESVVCRFWLAGNCIKGDSCPFTHGSGLVQQYEAANQQISRARAGHKPTPPSAEEFPALSAAGAPRPKFDFWAPTSKFADIAKKRTDPPFMNGVQSTYSGGRTPAKLPTVRVDTKWLQTGDSLAATYLKHRQDAIDIAIQRNKLFQRATEAYLSNNKAAAKAFSLQAHQLNNELRKAHQTAALQIFEERNKATASGNNGSYTIDLHGLHPEEAVEMLETSIARLRGQRFHGRILIVTGTGNHSRTKSKLLPAIHSYLYQKGFQAQEATMGDGRRGMFAIEL
ncbi:hypothetical protein BC832DRAFT_379402 [Gaertneriomyces semiglobifer]|nr:hypothetical protein BC832DRAFT_379402 [Gaertneriomyces semiglobifer]